MTQEHFILYLSFFLRRLNLNKKCDMASLNEDVEFIALNDSILALRSEG
jgi:hypothetical protein